MDCNGMDETRLQLSEDRKQSGDGEILFFTGFVTIIGETDYVILEVSQNRLVESWQSWS